MNNLTIIIKKEKLSDNTEVFTTNFEYDNNDIFTQANTLSELFKNLQECIELADQN